MAVGQSVWLPHLRQLTGTHRTNLNFTNTGLVRASVRVILFDSSGSPLKEFTVEIPPLQAVQDLEPFVNRAGQPDLGWGYAVVEVLEGGGVLASASVIDSRTNDPTTILSGR